MATEAAPTAAGWRKRMLLFTLLGVGVIGAIVAAVIMGSKDHGKQHDHTASNQPAVKSLADVSMLMPLGRARRLPATSGPVSAHTGYALHGTDYYLGLNLDVKQGGMDHSHMDMGSGSMAQDPTHQMAPTSKVSETPTSRQGSTLDGMMIVE